MPTSNFTYADVDGNILYVWNGRVPVRKAGGDYRLDVDAASSADLWAGLHQVDDYPRLLNPPGGYIQNANNPPRFVSVRDPIDMTRYPSYFERGPLALRPQLALDMLESRQTFSVDDVIALKHSTRMLLAERVKSDVIEAVRTDPRTQGPADPGTHEEALAGAATLEAWDNSCRRTAGGPCCFSGSGSRILGPFQRPFATPWDEANSSDYSPRDRRSGSGGDASRRSRPRRP